MRNGQQLAASLQSLNQQLDTSLVNSLALLDEMAKSAGSIASAARSGRMTPSAAPAPGS